MCITFISHRAEQPGNLVSLVIAIGIFIKRNIWNTEGNHSVLTGIQAHRNIQPFRKRSDLVRSSIAIGIFQNLNRVFTPGARLDGIRVFGRIGDPEPPFHVKRHIQRFLNLSF